MLVTVVAVATLVGAQVFAPAWAFAHTEPYAIALAVCCAVLAAYAVRASRGKDGAAGRGLWVCALGALVVALAGLASGLLGPDTQTLVKAPGSVAVVPSAGVAAVFPFADAAAIARGDARVVLRRRRGRDVEVAAFPRLVGGAVLAARPRLAAYVDVFDARGRHLTITQPTGPAFLSPVLQFGQTIAIEKQTLPSDEFSAPAARRLITAVYISAHDAGAIGASRIGDREVVLFSVRDDSGHALPGGIGVAQSGGEARVADLRIRATIGTYPVLVVGSAPLPAALAGGAALVVAGLALAIARGNAAVRPDAA